MLKTFGAGVLTISRNRIVVALLLGHSACALLVYLAIVTSSDAEAGMLWFVMFLLDFPASLFLAADPQVQFDPDEVLLCKFLLLGGAQWLVIGVLVQLTARWVRKSLKSTPRSG